jgi:hypothetical protein
MTRFDADAPTERRKLIADAVVAHRERDSAFLTLEAEPTAAEREAQDALAETDDGEDATGEEPASEDAPTVPWLQFSDQTFNLDCTDEELAALKSLLGEFPEFRIDQLDQPEDAAGTNVRITARADPNRLAMFADRVFQAVYGRDEQYRVWVVAI